jgi:hypothetical protein
MDSDQLATIRWRYQVAGVPYTNGREPISDTWMKQADQDLGQLLILVDELRAQRDTELERDERMVAHLTAALTVDQPDTF